MMNVFTSTCTLIISMPQVQEASAMGIYKFGHMNYVRMCVLTKSVAVGRIGIDGDLHSLQ